MAPKMVKIKFLDLVPTNKLKEELDKAYHKVMMRGQFINGPECQEFAEAWAEYNHKKYCFLTASGLDGLKIALKAYDIGNCSHVLVPEWTCVQTWLAITQIEAWPVTSWNEDIEAIMPVHLYGYPAEPLDYPTELNLPIIEDACQAHGMAVGTTAVFSFYPTKNLGAFGDAGAIVTDDDYLASQIKQIVNNSTIRMDTLQAAFLLTKLPYLDLWNEKRKQHAQLYYDNLQGVILPEWDDRSVWHQFVIRYQERDWLKSSLAEAGIEAMIHYPQAPRKILFDYSYRRDVDGIADTVLSLPVGPHLTTQEIEYVIENVNSLTGEN